MFGFFFCFFEMSSFRRKPCSRANGPAVAPTSFGAVTKSEKPACSGCLEGPKKKKHGRRRDKRARVSLNHPKASSDWARQGLSGHVPHYWRLFFFFKWALEQIAHNGSCSSTPQNVSNVGEEGEMRCWSRGTCECGAV